MKRATEKFRIPNGEWRSAPGRGRSIVANNLPPEISESRPANGVAADAMVALRVLTTHASHSSFVLRHSP